ncbi:HAD-IA family hydrolase [Candidatus Solincola tengchongensis]|uniref:HAD-IA family hydrolase n=1 Tax=Candidatus Solincola tengchongensis TaxID=2900693 RepID=UPI00257BFBBA|nr:HAD-IA family hydrolase [Candidatus Solincola tengchongensis]
MKRDTEYLLFDLDGTLVDTIRLILRAFRETFRALGLPPRDDREMLMEVGKPLYRQALDIDPGRADEIFRVYQEMYDKYYKELVKEYPGVREALAGLKERGYRLAVVTSKRFSNASLDLERFGLIPYLDVLVTAEDTENHKPDPEPVFKALEKLGGSAEKAVFIGDSPYDIRSAHAAGVRGGAAAWGPFPREVLEAERPDYWIPDPPSLLRIFQ